MDDGGPRFKSVVSMINDYFKETSLFSWCKRYEESFIVELTLLTFPNIAGEIWFIRSTTAAARGGVGGVEQSFTHSCNTQSHPPVNKNKISCQSTQYSLNVNPEQRMDWLSDWGSIHQIRCVQSKDISKPTQRPAKMIDNSWYSWP